MDKHEDFYAGRVSPEDWEKTPASVKILIKEMGHRLEEQRGYQLEEEGPNCPKPLADDKPSIKAGLADDLSRGPADGKRIIILIPVFNDWNALEGLLLQIDQMHLSQKATIEVLITDDFSTHPLPDSLVQQDYPQIRAIRILRLSRNLGHQRAIAVGLAYIYYHHNYDFVVVMDGDGEDNPLDIEGLLTASEKVDNKKIVFARRSKRSENRAFRFFYLIYKKLYRALVGREIKTGNFSLIPDELMKNLVVISEIWNHYASGIYHSLLPCIEVDTPRSKRLDGEPKMNLVSLVTHGLSSVAVYGDVVGTRILLCIGGLFVLLCTIFVIVFIIKFFTNLAIPGWATYVSGFLIIFLFQLIMIGAIFSIIILSSRNNFNFLPMRDYKYYVDDCFSLKS